ncbi:hypothetical protein PAMC26577_02100 [Caballeronia sordidicola]|uniref:Uncharacterized protein n=1 Tax=Caballeronia sordidicola TaxID=196367 RepID=A0A242N774_CABSO|nr:hypothetical protein PAMC26577_02100 [Caballeronia sordidicola]
MVFASTGDIANGAAVLVVSAHDCWRQVVAQRHVKVSIATMVCLTQICNVLTFANG